MPSAIDFFAKFVSSPAGIVAAGGVLAGIVWKFFERVESVLNENTKFEIAVWLVGKASNGDRRGGPPPMEGLLKWVGEVSRKALPTEKSFSKTWKLVGLATCVLAAGSLFVPHSISREILAITVKDGGFDAGKFFGIFFFTSLFAALGLHIAFIATRYIAKGMEETAAHHPRFAWLLFLNCLLPVVLVPPAIAFLLILGSFNSDVRAAFLPWAERLPTFGEIWLCSRLAISQTFPFVVIVAPMIIVSLLTLFLIVGGMALRGITSINFLDWFVRKFDIERHPLQSTGLVVGAIVAVVYWTAVGINRLW